MSAERTVPERMVEPILDLVAAGTEDEREAALDALLMLPLGQSDLARLAHVLDATITARADPAFVRASARVPIPAVQERLRELAEGEGDVAVAALLGLTENGDATTAERLVDRFAQSRDLGVLIAIASLPPGSVPADMPSLCAAAEADEVDTRFWAALALAKAGDDRRFRLVVEALGDPDQSPGLFWGDPWTPYERIAAAAPVPDDVHEYLAALLARADVTRDQKITAGALTGLVDAEGHPIG